MNTKWFKAALVRAIKTFAQTAAGMLVVGSTVTEINWVNIVSVAAVACVLSLLTSIAGLPEVE